MKDGGRRGGGELTEVNECDARRGREGTLPGFAIVMRLAAARRHCETPHGLKTRDTGGAVRDTGFQPVRATRGTSEFVCDPRRTLNCELL